MKNTRIKKAFLAFLGCLSVPGFAAVTPVTPQLNTEDQCYHISNKAELFGFAALVNAGERTICGKLDDNIVVNENVIKDGSFNSSAKESFDAWTPLENFSGKFDGNDKYISGLYSDASSGSAFVKSVLNGTSNAPVTIKNLGIVKSYFTGNTNYVGAFVGNSNTYLKISNSYIENTLVTGGNRIGGFIGSITSSVTTIENSFNRGTVKRETTEAGRIEDYAGFVGGIDGTGTLKISKCGYEGHVSGIRVVGGFLGYIGGNVVIENSYNRGSVVATADISGGFVGAIGSAGTLTIRNSYSAGTVTKSGSVGDAFIGSAASGTAPTVSNSYYLSTLSSSIGTSYEQTKFSDGTVAVKLHDYSDETDGVTGDAWGQDVTKENTYPDLSGKVLYPLTLVTYDGDANASTYPTKYVYKETKALPTNVERVKHAFKGWYANSSFEGLNLTSVASNEPGAKTYYAKFEKEFEVKFLDDDEKTEIKATQVVENGQKAVKPKNPARSEKYKFGGWYLDLNDEGASAYDFNKPVTSDISLYAYWIELITYVYKDADGNVLSTQYLTEEEVPVPPTEGLPTSENYKYLYSWDGRFDEETMVSTYTLVLDSVLKENKLAINATGFEAGNHIVIEQPSECVNVEGKLSPGNFESEDGVFSENLRSSQELSAYYDYYSYTLSTTLMINRVSDACKDDFYIKSFDYYKTMNVSLYADGKKKFEYVYDVTKNTAKLSDFQFDVGNYQYYEISFLDTNGVLVDVQSVIKSQMPKNPEVRDAGSDEKYIEFYDLPENVVPATQNASYTVSKTYKILRNSDYVVELDGLEAGKKIIVNNPSECVQLYFWLQGNGGSISDYESYTLEADAQYAFGIGHINIDWASEKCKDDIYIKSLAFNNKSAIYLKYKDNVVQGGEIYGFEKKTNIWGPLAFSTSKLYKISFYDEDGNLVSVNKFAAGETPYLGQSTTADGNFTIGYSSIDNFVAATKDTSYIVTADTTLDKIAVQLKDWKAGDYVELKNLSECVTLENVELIPQSSSSNAIDRRLSDNRMYHLGFDIHVDMNSDECQDDPYVKGINSTKGSVRIGILFPGGERFRYVGKTSFENPENGVLSFEYVFVTGAPEKHRVRIFDKNKKLVETQFVNNGSKARYRELKDKETEGYVYYYHLTEELANINGDHDYYETDVLDSVKKDYNIYISLSGAIAGDAIKMESPSECIVLAPMLLEGDNPPIEDLNYTLQENSDYVLLTFASIGFENEECNDETIKSVRYFMPNEIPIYLVMESDSLLTSYGYWNDGLYATGIRQPYIFSTGNVVLYNISFVGVDGNQIGETQKLLYNHKPVVPEVTLPKNNAQYTYSYHWDSKIVPAKGDFEYIAVLDSQVNAYTITVSVNDSKMGAVTGAGSYEYGAEITLVATALDGYKFSNWEDDAKAAATRKVTVTGEASYKANFEKIVVASSSSSSAKGSDVKPGSSSSVIPGSSSSVIPGSDPESRNSSSSAKSSSSKKASSSSSVKPGSSSSVKPGSSSSVKPSSSSSVKPGSSSSVIPGSDPESRNSSSSAKRNSSSSAKKDAIVASAKVPMFSVTVMGRSLQIAGAPVDAKIAVFDMQGGLVSTGRVDAANFNVAMPRSGSYMVRIGGQVQRVNVK